MAVFKDVALPFLSETLFAVLTAPLLQVRVKVICHALTTQAALEIQWRPERRCERRLKGAKSGTAMTGIIHRLGHARLFLLAAFLCLGCIPSAFALRAPSTSAPEPPENRVEGSDPFASGRLSIEDLQSPGNAMGSEGCGYENASGRLKWLNQDPIGEAGGLNLYAAMGNNPVNYVDPFGLDLWVIQFPGFPGHQGVVGTDPDGGYWLHDFYPADDGWHLFYPGKLDFNPKWHDPNDTSDGTKVCRSMRTTPEQDRINRDRAKKAHEGPAPYYNLPFGMNCATYACQFFRNGAGNPPTILYPPTGPRNGPPSTIIVH